MFITLAKSAKCGSQINLPPAEYVVVLASGTSEFILTGGGRQFKIPAVKRRQNAKTKTTSVMFYSGGGALWSIVVSDPKFGEWIAMIEYEAGPK